MIYATADFQKRLARAGLSMTELADKAEIHRTTPYTWVEVRPTGKRRPIRAHHAWRVAKAYAEQAGVSEEEAFSRLFVEEEQPAVAPEAADVPA